MNAIKLSFIALVVVACNKPTPPTPADDRAAIVVCSESCRMGLRPMDRWSREEGCVCTGATASFPVVSPVTSSAPVTLMAHPDVTKVSVKDAGVEADAL